MMEHKIIIGKRQTGKTERLIKESAEKQIPIICTSSNYVKETKRRAKEMGLDIPDPVPATSLGMNEQIRQYRSVLVDDAVLVLSCMLGKNIDTVAINTGHEALEPIEVIYTEDEDKEEK